METAAGLISQAPTDQLARLADRATVTAPGGESHRVVAAIDFACPTAAVAARTTRGHGAELRLASIVEDRVAVTPARRAARDETATGRAPH